MFKFKLLVAIILGISASVAFFSIAQYRSENTKATGDISCPKCNVIMINVDILRADALPCYGYSRNTAPNICKFSEKGSLFTNNFSQSFFTLPAIVSTVTSLYPSDHRVFTQIDSYGGPKIKVLPEILKEDNYYTHFQGEIYTRNINSVEGFFNAFDTYDYDHNLTHWLTTVRKVQKLRRPFFIYLYSNDLHLPYFLNTTTKFIEKYPVPNNFPLTGKDFLPVLYNYIFLNYKNIFTEKALHENAQLFTNPSLSKQAIGELYLQLRTQSDMERLKDIFDPTFRAYTDHVLGMGSDGVQFMRMLYDSKITEVDRVLGELLDYVNESSLKDNTIIVIYSEHGEEFGEHGSYGHGYRLYNELLHTPLIIYVPNGKPAQIRFTTENIDIIPTVLDLLNIQIPSYMKGSSLKDVLQNSVISHDKYAISEGGDELVSIQNPEWKLIVNNYKSGTDNFELYHLMTDPKETANVYQSHHDIVVNLLKYAGHRISRSISPSPTPFIKNLDPQKLEKLKKQGYF